MRSRRRRGGTFTLIVLCVCMILIVAGTAFFEPMTHAIELESFRERQSQAREGALAGLEWARAASAQRPSGKGELALGHAQVAVVFDGGKLESTSTVSRGTEHVRIVARARLKDGRISELTLDSK